MKKIMRKLFPKLYGKLAYLKMKNTVKTFKSNYPDCKLFYDLYNKEETKLYSQENQDYIIYNAFFKDKKDGVFCDVGGNDPLNLNNTRYFEEIGWTGFVFEPLPQMKILWEKYRKAKYFPFGASDVEGETIFSVVKQADGFDETVNMLSFVKDTRNTPAGYATEDIKVKIRTIKNVFGENNIEHIDYMSIDVEGHELNVLEGIDFDSVRINVISIENCSIPNTVYGDEAIRILMQEHNYILWGRIVGLDDIYVHKNFIMKSKNNA
jgi:FkbM family methyltransferase